MQVVSFEEKSFYFTFCSTIKQLNINVIFYNIAHVLLQVLCLDVPLLVKIITNIAVPFQSSFRAPFSLQFCNDIF